MPEMIIKYNRGINALRNALIQPRKNALTKCVVYWGAPGIGKSKKAWELYPEAYSKNDTKWWDYYNGEDTVIWDDFTPDCCSWNHFCKLIDHNPLLVETKGGTVNFNSKLLFITSNIDPAEWWPNIPNRDALIRRIDIYASSNSI